MCVAHPFRWMVAILLSAFALSVPVLAGDDLRFVITPGAGSTQVRFDSKATLESFSGTTHQAGGEIRLDPIALGDSVVVHVEVELATLDTGLGLRNQHMRDNHLETSRFPLAIFRGARIVTEHATGMTPGEVMTLEIEGLLALHGIERPVRVPVSVVYEVTEEQERLGIECRFSVKLSDHGIPRPQFLALKVADEQKITFRALAVRAD